MTKLEHWGVVGIVKVALTVLLQRPKLFLCLSLVLLLPITVINLCAALLLQIAAQSLLKLQPQDAAAVQKMLHEAMQLLLVAGIYVCFVSVLWIFAIASLVYSVAHVYLFQDRPISFRRALNMVPRVWKHLFLTLVWANLNFFAVLVMFGLSLIAIQRMLIGSTISSLVMPLSLFALVYLVIQFMVVYWLACMVSVLEEDHYGIEAVKTSVRILKGSKGTGRLLTILNMSCLTLAQLALMPKVSIRGLTVRGLAGEVVCGVLLCLVVTLINLIGIAIQTMFYFSCKAYHHEAISALWSEESVRDDKERGLLSQD